MLWNFFTLLKLSAKAEHNINDQNGHIILAGDHSAEVIYLSTK